MRRFHTKITRMETGTNESTRTYWIIFIVTTVIMILMLIFMNEWFWLALPFSATFLAKALRVL